MSAIYFFCNLLTVGMDGDVYMCNNWGWAAGGGEWWTVDGYQVEMPKHPLLLLLTEIYQTTQIARFMGPKWGPSGADRAHFGPINFVIWEALILRQEWSWSWSMDE